MKCDMDEVIGYAKAALKEEKVSGYDHAQRVAYWCQFLGEKHPADLQALRIASCLHDIGLKKVGLAKHHTESAKMAEAYLREKHLPEEDVAFIGSIIEHHAMHAPEAEAIEEQIINDAVVGLIEYRRPRIPVDSDDRVGTFHSGDVLERA